MRPISEQIVPVASKEIPLNFPDDYLEIKLMNYVKLKPNQDQFKIENELRTYFIKEKLLKKNPITLNNRNFFIFNIILQPKQYKNNPPPEFNHNFTENKNLHHQQQQLTNDETNKEIYEILDKIRQKEH